ncbi:hypothetical protein PMI14_06796 [Acidovorax sp. CF316]|uniref:toll/interleukin-1 receptor domain-containing protein n=1 Tax=Acidovorax sp. CF316 TaxID=1144317 RepID=UPI00026BE2FD|nr:toll/interleukin-1 receptor domain-containing protein [Acidovorax sp. CF316]EJE48768.1 hypothetical protein PMI14_06796 [Acidovorax sp. CF316]
MNVFISWSGTRSQATAEIFKTWIKCVLQATRPWVSTQDIERGARWRSDIEQQLQTTTQGIICLTKANLNAPWILFEAGALAKGLDTARVYTVLVDLTPTDVGGPLAQFNHTTVDKASMEKLVISMNRHLTDPVDTGTLLASFEAHWPTFKSQFDANVLSIPETATVPADRPDVSHEILATLRAMSNRMADIESALEPRTALTPTEKFLEDQLRPGETRAMAAARVNQAFSNAVLKNKTAKGFGLRIGPDGKIPGTE